MNRERVLKAVMVSVGLLFTLAVYPVTDCLWHVAKPSDYGDDMLAGVDFTVGIFLLLAARNPPANRSLIAFTAWSSFAHAAVMATLAIENPSERGGFLVAVAVLVAIGIALIALPPAKDSAESSSPALL